MRPSYVITVVALMLVLALASGCAPVSEVAERPETADGTVLALARSLSSGDESAAADFVWPRSSSHVLADSAIRRLGARDIEESTMFILPQGAAARDFAPPEPFLQRASVIGDYVPLSGPVSQWEDVAGFKIDLGKTAEGWFIVSGTDVRRY